MIRHFLFASLFVLALVLAAAEMIAQAPKSSGPKRALPPRWGDDVKNLFPEDAMKGVTGPRPDFAAGAGAGATNVASNNSTGGPATPMTQQGVTPGAMAWSKLIDADTVLAEIKSYQTLVASDVKSVSEFNGGGYKKSCISYSMLGVMFAVILEYDGEIRFKKEALAARELFGRAGINLKVFTQQSFNESKARSEDLANLIRGESLPEPAGAEPKVKWIEKVAKRPPLMARLNTATEERLSKLLSDANAFNKGLDQVLHEAQIVAVISAGIQREGYEHADDDTYLGYARQMQTAATDIVTAAKAKNYDGASKAFSIIKQKCDDCHGSYR